MEKSINLKNTYKVLLSTYLTIIISAIIFKYNSNTSTDDLIINITNIYNLLFLKIINKRMNGENKELYEGNYCKIILAGIIIVLITTTAIKYIIKDEHLISQINDTLRIELLISFIISCAAYIIFTKTKKDNKLNEIKKDTVTIDKDKNKKIYKNIIIESVIISFIYLIMASVIILMQYIMVYIMAFIGLIGIISIILIGFSAG